MNKRHSHSTTTIQLHLTTADYQRICQNPASEFFLNKTTRIYARGLQKERYTVLSNNSDSRPSNFLFQIARGSGAKLSVCPFFFKKAHVTKKTCSRQTTSRPHDIPEFFFYKEPENPSAKNQSNFKTRPSSYLFQIARGSGATPSWMCFFLQKGAHHPKISRSATRFRSRKHSDDACSCSTRPKGTRRGFQS